MKRINALTIAGTDPSGGAGIQADLKTFSALGAYGCSVITALVAQNTRGVQSVYRIEPDFVAAQLDSVFSDVRIDTTKIGMLAETDIVEAVAERLQRYQIQNVVLDTVMLAKKRRPAAFTFGGCYAAQSIIATGFINNAKLARSCRLARRATRAHRTGNAGTRAIAVGDGLWRSANERWSSG
ncbi:phosphomethylpyrimidine kinase [Escherichia coli]|nr:phosphomethylpyrimidine kinase [Escherichia coli]STI54510.1 phosphomethylpyrimidine kinase [Escherichia coli]